MRRFLTTHKDGRLTDIEKDAKWFFDAATTSKNITTSFAMRSTIRFGLPLETYLNRADRSKEQLEAIKTIFKRCANKSFGLSSGIETQWWHEWDANVLQVRSYFLGRNTSHFI